MKIIDRLPFGERPHIVSVGHDRVDLHRNQIIVWISIGNVLSPLPAILDTGHGHNLSVGRQQLNRWGGSVGEDVGDVDVGGKTVIQYAADVRIHRNVPGKPELRGDSYQLDMPQGISVFEDEPPRLPLLGLRTIIANKLRIAIDGDRRQMTLKTKGWF